MLAQRAKFVLACAAGVPGGWREFGAETAPDRHVQAVVHRDNIADGTGHRPARPTCVEASSIRK
jgi:hypothetical protein